MKVIRHLSFAIGHLFVSHYYKLVTQSGLLIALSLWYFVLCTLLLFTHITYLKSQINNEVAQAIERLEKGDVAEVKQQLPELITKYQNDAGVLYLQGRLATNGNEAKQFYQTIVTNFPKSEWADDALYRLYQYNYAMGLYRTASAQLQQLAKNYPESPYVKSVPQSGLPKIDKPVPVAKEGENTPSKTEQLKPPFEQNETKQIANQERFTLQVGAFSTSPNAEKVKSSFEEKGYRVEIASKVQNGKSLYKVWVGSYKTRVDAEKALKDVKAKFGLNAMVIER